VLWSRRTGATLGVLVAALVAAAPAMADKPPQVTHIPEITGTAQVGQTLRAVNAAWRGEDVRVSWTWLRCSSRDVRDCRGISGTNDTSYRVTGDDLGRRMRVLLMLSNDDGSAWAISPETNVVASAPSAPAPTPTPAPTPSPSPSPTPANPGTEPGGTPPPGPTAPAATPTMMKPFPLIRIRGSLTRMGAKVSLLTVKAPRGAAISVRCFGRSCPLDKWAHKASVTRIFAFQKRLRAGTRIVITVTKRNRIGKHTTFVIRKGKPPKRIDRCLYPGEKKPTKCVAT
jgi:hypothetical protein